VKSGALEPTGMGIIFDLVWLLNSLAKL